MLKDITLGQFFPGHTMLHRCDPRTKILLVAAIIAALFICDTLIPYLILTVFIFGLVLSANLKLKMVLRGIKPILFIIIFTAVLNLFTTGGDDVIWRAGVVSITLQGVYRAVLLAVRLALLVVGASILTYTTSPIQLTDGLERMFSPLKKLHVPVHELAMVMSLALRFIPTLIEETDKIMSAQRARGADFDSGSLLQRGKALIPILVPLFVSSFRRADELATAMECRLYRGDVGRTRLHQLKFGHADAVCAVITVVFLSAAIALQFVL